MLDVRAECKAQATALIGVRHDLAEKTQLWYDALDEKESFTKEVRWLQECLQSLAGYRRLRVVRTNDESRGQAAGDAERCVNQT